MGTWINIPWITLYYYELWIFGVRFLFRQRFRSNNKLIGNGAEHSTGANAGNGGVASGGVSNIRLWILRCTRHSLQRCWPPLLFQRMLHRGLHRFHLWQWQVHVQGNSLINFTGVCVFIYYFTSLFLFYCLQKIIFVTLFLYLVYSETYISINYCSIYRKKKTNYCCIFFIVRSVVYSSFKLA